MKMESQLSIAQDKIGAAKWRTKLPEQKNEYLQKELDSWNEDTTPEVTSYLQSAANGSGIPSIGMTISLPSVSLPPSASMLVIGGPPVTPILMSGPTLSSTPFGGPQSNFCVLFGSVFDASLGQVEITMEMMAMVELLDPKLYRHSCKEYQHSIWELSPKTL